MARIRGPIPFDQFKQRVRRHRTTDVLEAIAAFSAELVNVAVLDPAGRPASPSRFNTSHSLPRHEPRCCTATSTAYRPVGSGDLRDMCGYFLQVTDPALEQEPGMDRMRRMLSRILYEQASFQYSEMENVGRSVALLLEHAEGCDGALSADEWRELLGVTLEEFMRIGFGMHVAALCNGGQISRGLLEAPHVAAIFTPLSAEQALAVIDTTYVGTVAESATSGAPPRSPAWRSGRSTRCW